jgi:serine/threonine-protein kinase
LREKIEAGPLKLDEAIKFAMQIADGLQAAHEKGITHRDIKSANIMITDKGQAKIMDFGLAKLAGRTVVTKEGTTLGTIAYMSPEQARGEEVDHRTDIWAFGVVLYEMIAGQLPFKGEYEQAVMYSIVNEDPEPLTSLRSNVPMDLERVVDKMLAKNPAERYQHVDELPVDLRVIEAKPSGISKVLTRTTGATVLSRLARSKKSLFWIMAGLIIAAFAAGATVWKLLHPTASIPKPLVRFNLDLPPGHQFGSLWLLKAAISPDGRLLAYAADSAGSSLLYLRPLDQLKATPLADTDGAFNPFFSPDGKWIGFFIAGKLKKISIDGGTVLTICDAPSGTGASWTPDNTIIFAPSFNTGLVRVSADGGVPQSLPELDHTRKEASHGLPQVLPDGQSIIFTIESSGRSFNEATIVVQALTTGERRVLVKGGTCGRYVPTGHLLYARSNSLLAVPFDLKSLAVTGTAVEVLAGIVLNQERGASHFACSGNGTLIYLPGGEDIELNELVFVDRSGKHQRISQRPATYYRLSLATDRRRMAVQISAANDDIWLVDMERDTQTRLTFEAENLAPIWMADGRKIVFSSDRDSEFNLYTTPADGSGTVERLTTSEASQRPTSCAPNGRLLAFDQQSVETGWDIWLLPLEGERKPRPFRKTAFDELGARFSPDGRWLAYVSNESGQFDVYVQPLFGSSTKWQISVNGGYSPRWSRGGREIVYRNGDKMMAVEVSTEPTFKAGRPHLLFEGKYSNPGVFGDFYDVTPDGERFVMIKPGELNRLTRMSAVLNWFEELKRLVPSDN